MQPVEDDSTPRGDDAGEAAKQRWSATSSSPRWGANASSPTASAPIPRHRFTSGDDQDEAAPVRRKQRHLVTEALHENEELTDRIRQLDEENDRLREEKEAIAAELAEVVDQRSSRRSSRKKSSRLVEALGAEAQDEDQPQEIARPARRAFTREALQAAKLNLDEQGDELNELQMELEDSEERCTRLEEQVLALQAESKQSRALALGEQQKRIQVQKTAEDLECMVGNLESKLMKQGTHTQQLQEMQEELEAKQAYVGKTRTQAKRALLPSNSLAAELDGMSDGADSVGSRASLAEVHSHEQPFADDQTSEISNRVSAILVDSATSIRPAVFVDTATSIRPGLVDATTSIRPEFVDTTSRITAECVDAATSMKTGVADAATSIPFGMRPGVADATTSMGGYRETYTDAYSQGVRGVASTSGLGFGDTGGFGSYEQIGDTGGCNDEIQPFKPERGGSFCAFKYRSCF